MIDVPAKDVNAPELFNQIDFEVIPVVNVDEGASLVRREGLEGDEEFGAVVTSG